MNLTAESLTLFLDLANDAGNWSGTPLVDITNAERGNLTDLKRKGLLSTMESDGDSFAMFTAAGVALAASHGIDIAWVL